MKVNISIFIICLFSYSINAQEREQFVKWGASMHYTKSLDKSLEDSVNPAIFCDVAIGHNDVFDASPLYFEFYLDYSIRNRNEVNTISGGGNIKKYIAFGNSKRDFYLIGGGKITFIKNFEKYMSDYSLNIGFGVALSNLMEINTFYTQGLTNSYLSSNREFIKAQNISIGIRFFFKKNWWY